MSATSWILGLLSLTLAVGCHFGRDAKAGGQGRGTLTCDQIGPMSTFRRSPEVAALPDGRVLIASHTEAESARAMDATGLERRNVTDLFDARAHAFFALPPLPTCRVGMSLSQLPDGALLLAGGVNPQGGTPGTLQVLDTLERYDPVMGRYDLLPAKLVKARISHQAIPLLDGRTLILGGQDQAGLAILEVEAYDPKLGTCRVVGRLGQPRGAGFIAVRLLDGRVLVAGGREEPASAEYFEPKRKRFVPLPQLGVEREGAVAVLLKDGRVLVAGGSRKDDPHAIESSAECFLPGQNRFTSTGTLMGACRAGAAGLLLPDGHVLIAGGYDTSRLHRATELFDPITRAFTPGPDLPITLMDLKLAPLPNGEVLGVGGGSEDAVIFRPASQ